MKSHPSETNGYNKTNSRSEANNEVLTNIDGMTTLNELDGQVPFNASANSGLFEEFCANSHFRRKHVAENNVLNPVCSDFEKPICKLSDNARVMMQGLVRDGMITLCSVDQIHPFTSATTNIGKGSKKGGIETWKINESCKKFCH